MQPIIQPQWLRHDIRTLAMWVMCASVLANFLPRASHLRRWPWVCGVYSFLIDMVALLACNWRVALPSLDEEFLGFRRRSQEWVAGRLERRRKRHAGRQ